MDINTLDQADFYKVLGISDLSDSEKALVIKTLGESVLENSLLRFVLTLDDWAQESFEQWVKAHAEDTDLIEQVVTLYPGFASILIEEILLVKDSFQNKI